jgi:hypothetical protein
VQDVVWDRIQYVCDGGLETAGQSALRNNETVDRVHWEITRLWTEWFTCHLPYSVPFFFLGGGGEESVETFQITFIIHVLQLPPTIQQQEQKYVQTFILNTINNLTI